MPTLNLELSTAPGTADRASIAGRLTSLTAEVPGRKPELTAITVESVDPAPSRELRRDSRSGRGLVGIPGAYPGASVHRRPARSGCLT